MTRLVLATTNPNKVREIRALLAGVPVEIVGLEGFPAIEPPVEDGATFEDNAALKARYYAAATGATAVAEDSGLEIDRLGGMPGVESARFAGANSSYPEKFARLYAMLDAAGGRESTARFVCAVAVARGDEILFSTRGTVEGRINAAPRGAHGFGYDPIFWYPPFKQTTAQLPDPIKAIVSHRARAFRDLRRRLNTLTNSSAH